MAACAACGNAGVVHRRATFEAGGVFVAGFTGRTGHNVGAWFSFDAGKAATVTGRTASRDASVVHRRWLPTSSFMTSITRLSSRNMSRLYSRSSFAVTSCTSSRRNICMTHSSWFPACDFMASVT